MKAKPTCEHCRAFTALPCTQHNYNRCALYQAKLSAPRDVDPHRPNDPKCCCAECCNARARAILGANDPAALEAKAKDDAFRVRVLQLRAERKAKRKAAKEAAANDPKRRNKRKAGPPGAPGSRKERKAARRAAWLAKKGVTTMAPRRALPVKAEAAPVLDPTVKRRQIEGGELAEITAMLSYRRPHKSDSELEFIRRFIWPEVSRCKEFGCDNYGNVWCIVPRGGKALKGKAPNPLTTLFSAHTDDVSYQSGTRNVRVDLGIARLAHGDKSSCLGADNAAGVWILLELIRAHVPGVYVFHRNEERGGMGSDHFVATNKNDPRFKLLKRAVAFDRRRYHSVITHQRGQRCASEVFALALCKALDLGGKPDDGGTFTDTANYVDYIPECTNVSVGFQLEHSREETLDIGYLVALRDACVWCDWDALPTVRVAGSREPKAYGGTYSRGNVGSSQPSVAGEAMRRAMLGDKAKEVKSLPAPRRVASVAPETTADDLDDLWHSAPRTLMQLCEDYPEHVVSILEDWGYNAKTLHAEILHSLGIETTH